MITLAYIDTSAFLKLFLKEGDSADGMAAAAAGIATPLPPPQGLLSR
jgi:hypothetical protein